MKLTLIILSIFFTFVSCSKNEETKKSNKKKSNVVSKFKNMKEQEPPPRHVIDVNEEEFTSEDVVKINSEIPVLELIVGKNWTQSDYNKLSSFKTLDFLKIENTDVSSIDFSFTESMGSRKTISFLNSKISDKSAGSIKSSSLKEIIFSATESSSLDLESIKNKLKGVNISIK